MQKTLSIIALVLLFVLGSFVGYWLRGLRPGQPAQPQKPDTVYLDSIIYVDKPVPVEVTPKGFELVPVGTIDRITKQINALEDSLDKKPKIVVKDSLIYIDVPIESKHYGDSTYDAWVSGYKPSLDSLRFHYQKEIVKVPIPKYVTKRWGVGVQAGATYLPKVGFTPYVGIGISYNIITF